jgi:hypothetical protein
VKEWYGCSVEIDVCLADFYDEFSKGTFDNEPVFDDARQVFVKVLAGNSKLNLTKVSPTSKISDVVQHLGPFIKFVLAQEQQNDMILNDESATVSVNHFLMTAARMRSTTMPSFLPPLFDETHHQGKNKLKNDILKWLNGMSLGWSDDCVKSLGLPFVNTLTDALWYIDRNQDTMSKRGCSIPVVLQQFCNYRFPEKQKKRKIDESFLKNGDIKAHSSALFNLAMASYLKKDRWKAVVAAVVGLAESLQKYSAYLTSQAKRVNFHFKSIYKSFNMNFKRQ